DCLSSLAIGQYGTLDSSLLPLATALGQRQEFLTTTLTYAYLFNADITAAWSQVSPAEREAALQAALAKAAKQTDRPNAAVSRAWWKTAVLDAWSASGS
ncbi:MAG: hypothetical protein JWO82_448, partial [Akkermansiaceae bacterium]|nr:hypothetical protein [Akkermansiaceae bacterium]